MERPAHLRRRGVALTTPLSREAAAIPIPGCGPMDGEPVSGWDLDHVVMLVPDIDEAIATLDELDVRPRLRIDVRGRPTAFFRL